MMSIMITHNLPILSGIFSIQISRQRASTDDHQQRLEIHGRAQVGVNSAEYRGVKRQHLHRRRQSGRSRNR